MICRVLIKNTEKPDTIHDFKEYKLLTINVLIIIKDQLFSLVNGKFLGWDGGLPHPIDRKDTTRITCT